MKKIARCANKVDIFVGVLKFWLFWFCNWVTRRVRLCFDFSKNILLNCKFQMLSHSCHSENKFWFLHAVSYPALREEIVTYDGGSHFLPFISRTHPPTYLKLFFLHLYEFSFLDIVQDGHLLSNSGLVHPLLLLLSLIVNDETFVAVLPRAKVNTLVKPSQLPSSIDTGHTSFETTWRRATTPPRTKMSLTTKCRYVPSRAILGSVHILVSKSSRIELHGVYFS